MRVKMYVDRCLAGETHQQLVEVDMAGNRILEEYFHTD